MEIIYNDGDVAIGIDDDGVRIQTQNPFDDGFTSVYIPKSIANKIDFSKLTNNNK